MKKYIKVIFENGDNLKTEINGTKKEILQYYLGNYFNLGIERDNMQKCIKVEFLQTNKQ